MRLSSLAGLMLLLAGLAQAQNPTPFDCQFSGTLTAASPTSAAYFNKGPTAPCVSFRVTYYTTNASGVSLSLQGTGSLPNGNPDTAHWTNLTAQTGSSNPAIGTVSGSISAAYDYYPWIQLTAGTLTGTNATLTYTTLAYKGDSAKLNGGGSITGGPFTSGDVVTGAGGQAIQDSGTLLSSLIVNPMTAVGDMIAGGTSPAGVPTRVPPNVSLVPRVLTQSGDGTNAGQPTWSVIASGLIYYATDTASDIATDLQYTSATFSPKTTLGPYALSVGTTNLQTWATNSGAPGASFIPAGIYVVHLHYSRSPAPIGTIQLQAVINEVSSTGVFIANIGTTELSPVINPQGGEQEDDLAYADSNTYTFASTSSRVSVIVQAVSTSATPTVSLYVGGTADAHIELPSPGGGGSGSTTAYTTVTYSATPTFTVTPSTAVQDFQITLTGAVTSSTLATGSATNGQDIAFIICQDGTGGWTFSWPPNVYNASLIDPTASACTRQVFRWSGSQAIAVAPAISDAAGVKILTPSGAITFPTPPVTLASSTSATTVNGASCALGGSCTANWISGSISNLHIAQFTGTSGEIQDGGVLGSAASHAATDFQAAGSYVAGASALTTQYNIPIVSGTPGTLMQGGLFNPSGGVLAPMAADSTTAIQLCRHNGITCDVTYDSTNGQRRHRDDAIDQFGCV